MSQHYSDPSRESETYSLPDVEVFHVAEGEYRADECPMRDPFDEDTHAEDHGADCAGWFYWFCSPGCMPDSDPHGPFATEAEALADAQEGQE